MGAAVCIVMAVGRGHYVVPGRAYNSCSTYDEAGGRREEPGSPVTSPKCANCMSLGGAVSYEFTGVTESARRLSWLARISVMIAGCPDRLACAVPRLIELDVRPTQQTPDTWRTRWTRLGNGGHVVGRPHKPEAARAPVSPQSVPTRANRET